MISSDRNSQRQTIVAEQRAHNCYYFHYSLILYHIVIIVIAIFFVCSYLARRQCVARYIYIVYIVVLLPFSPITMIIIISMWYWVHISVNHMPTQYFIIIIIYIFILQRRNNVHIVAAAVGRFRARGRAKLSVVCQIGWCILFEHAVCACVLMLNEKMDELPSSCVHWTRNTWVAKYFHIYTQ